MGTQKTKEEVTATIAAEQQSANAPYPAAEPSLHTAYFGSVSWYGRLLRGAVIDGEECYVKQTERNHCRIATANGMQKLTVPVTVPQKLRCPIRDVRISDHGNWRHQHWEALKSAYGMSPFFEYYADDIHPFFEKRWDYLLDYNQAITDKMLELLGTATAVAEAPADGVRPYYQTFQLRHGFIPDLSILDLLFNEGPEAILYL